MGREREEAGMHKEQVLQRINEIIEDRKELEDCLRLATNKRDYEILKEKYAQFKDFLKNDFDTIKRYELKGIAEQYFYVLQEVLYNPPMLSKNQIVEKNRDIVFQCIIEIEGTMNHWKRQLENRI